MAEDLTRSARMGLRRLRSNPAVRELVREATVQPNQFLQPIFSVESISTREEIPGLTGTFRDTPETVLKQIESDLESGVSKFLLFGVPSVKSLSDFSSNFTASQVEAIKRRFGKDVFLAVDVCLCSSTTHGQCGVLNAEGDHVENGATVKELVSSALAFAHAGADVIAPSDMMDGRIGAIRSALDASGLERTLVMSYSAKFHSRFYGPFRIAADSAPKGGITQLSDRATYQIDPGTPRDALASSLRDAEEGADILMVKPGLPYLDVLASLSKEIPLPWAVYEVSGEYAAIELMSQQGLMQRIPAHVEAWTAFKRAGASIIISYGARYARDWLREANK